MAEAGGTDSSGPVDHVALSVDDEEIDSVADRAGDLGCDVERNAPHQLFVGDPYGMEWELNAHPRPPSAAFHPFDV